MLALRCVVSKPALVPWSLGSIRGSLSSSLSLMHGGHALEQRRGVAKLIESYRLGLWNKERDRQKSLAAESTMTATETDRQDVPAEQVIHLFGKKGKMIPGHSTPLELARRYNQKRANQYVVARINGDTPWDMQRALPKSTQSLEFFDFASNEDIATTTFWRSSAYIMASAMIKTYGNELMLCNSSVVPNDGFYYDFFLFNDSYDHELDLRNKQGLPYKERIDRLFGSTLSLDKFKFMSMDQTAALRKIVLEIVRDQYAFEYMDVDYEFARKLFVHNPFELRALDREYHAPSESNRTSDDDAKRITLFRCNLHIGIYREPLIVNTRQMQAFIATRVSSVHPTSYMDDGAGGATGASQQAQPTLNRLHAISFPIATMYKLHQQRIAETERRNHRLIGKNQKLFMMHPWAPGSGFILPHGQRMVNTIMTAIRREYAKYGFDEVSSPLMYNRKLWEKSGHWENYRDDMFTISPDALSTKESKNAGCCSHHEVESDQPDSPEFGLKPMNCPGHCLIYANELRSYRDLPIRYADFSPLHRNEIAGALSGLTRVRKFHQDDGHIFCTREQVQGEIEGCIKMIDDIYSMFGFSGYEFALSTRPDKFIGDIHEWNDAEAALTEALTKTGKSWTLNEGDGAFYGPKIDVRVQDSIGRKHQTATIQLDFQLPRRFDLKYTGSDGQQHQPVMIHRAVLGSMERMLAILIEHWAGQWPFWINPRQAMVIPVTTKDED
ncbi:hypothetical protein EV175_003752, partial [Coemansia sp. RSA 1933]